MTLSRKLHQVAFQSISARIDLAEQQTGVCLDAVVQHPCDRNPLSAITTLALVRGPPHFLYSPASTRFCRGAYFGMFIGQGEAECMRQDVRGRRRLIWNALPLSSRSRLSLSHSYQIQIRFAITLPSTHSICSL